MGLTYDLKYWSIYVQIGQEKPDVTLWNTSPFTLVETEELLYDLSSFIAEVGGILGLFLGFSFMAIWDEGVALTKLIATMYGKKLDGVSPVDNRPSPD